MNGSYKADLRLALGAAEAAAAYAVEARSGAEYRVDAKADGSPVSTADLRAEEAVRQLIVTERPDDHFLGEESPRSFSASASRVWVVDPIDATRNFVRGIPIWATLIALLDQGHPVVGVVYAPDLGRCWWAAAGEGAFCGESPSDQGRKIHTRDTEQPQDAYISTTAFDTWNEYGLMDEYQYLASRSYCNRGFGDFFQHCLVAEGVLDAALEPVVAPWDVAALVPVVSEAGGKCTDLHGGELPVAGGRGIVSSTPALHQQIMEVFTR
ncbi:inositol monophosphatase family protein [Nocardiopsis kunsanensis]|uniref:Histidinol-phosphatase n=1 Tax=Nocardiopsis kunsanensis TaxID=141693 RepID=A0A919CHL8_9ACTN|nr:inositol monophosphatase family protein [Nocardiopsis kunsanensis]GHD26425.1 histidinol-phosphatase [Nocardiopsis kunsanensis]